MSDILNRKISRRTLLRIGGCAGITVAAGGVTGIILDSQTDIFDSLRGITDTPLLENKDAWDYTDNTLTLALSEVPDLAEPSSAVRLESDELPEPLLIVRAANDDYYVFVNKCTHGDRKMDLADGKLRCVSMSHSKFDLEGDVLSGPAKDRLTTYEVVVSDEQLIITLA
ncbi:MAG: Rieske (2Fe-2S) protein [Anaerolineae bacterium]|nr:Rieske (2Fe-2S) protein [Anaerolineae bacterium]